jgi:hypothetical protein
MRKKDWRCGIIPTHHNTIYIITKDSPRIHIGCRIFSYSYKRPEFVVSYNGVTRKIKPKNIIAWRNHCDDISLFNASFQPIRIELPGLKVFRALKKNEGVRL